MEARVIGLLNDIKSLKKEAQIIKKEIETNTKNLDSKK